jgi:hypothetical protein
MESSAALAETRAYLASPAALDAVNLDPYWPKWDSPYWRMLLLFEMGLASEIPGDLARAFAASLDARCLRFFPYRVEDVPKGFPHQKIPCHCQLGCAAQMLAAAGVDVDAALPWVRPWLLRYQMADGGLNCDEAAYLRERPHSSILSTLPPLEAVLRATARPFTPDEERFLDRGARYLIERRLCRSISRGGALMDPTFLEPTFPRFYDYDVLRGLSFLLEWAERLERPLPEAAIAETVAHLEARERRDGGIAVGRRAFAGVATFRPAPGEDPHGGWTARVPAAHFSLLDAVSVEGERSPHLERAWTGARARLERLRARGLVVAS